VTRETDHPPTVALIGRVVPIKDIKTFIRACGLLRRVVPDLRAYVLGPTDEDPDYFEQCRTIVEHLELEETITFTGRVNLREWLGRIDVVALTSISEAQPLVILEAAAFGIPVVATDVGACREMIEGALGESPAIGAAGIVIPLSNPVAAAEAMARLLGDSDFYNLCGAAAKQRLRDHYDKGKLDAAYRDLYADAVALPSAETRRGEAA
jgi:glycosyltransferase involved in cell wall biosynthesis